jgi:hypothetical protein
MLMSHVSVQLNRQSPAIVSYIAQDIKHKLHDTKTREGLGLIHKVTQVTEYNQIIH